MVVNHDTFNIYCYINLRDCMYFDLSGFSSRPYK